VREIAYKNIVVKDEDNSNLILNYFFLVEEECEGYGIKVSKTDENNKELEIAKVMFKSLSKNGAKDILKKIVASSVTPVSFEEVVNELFEEEKGYNLYSYECVGC
jgi:hypothetical protein